jgi:hypothetical protein
MNHGLAEDWKKMQEWTAKIRSGLLSTQHGSDVGKNAAQIQG